MANRFAIVGERSKLARSELVDPIGLNVNRRERHIDVPKRRLIDALTERAIESVDRASFVEFARLLDRCLHAEYQFRFDLMKRSYEPFDPEVIDPAINPPNSTSGADSAHSSNDRPTTTEPIDRDADSAFAGINELFQRANYRKLTKEELLTECSGASDWGIEQSIDWKIFARLDVFVRGEAMLRRSQVKGFLRKRRVERGTPGYRRLAVAARLDPKGAGRRASGVDSRAIYLKLFRDIPKQDMEMVLPGTRLKMRRVDQGRIALPTLTGVGIAGYKVIAGGVTMISAGIGDLLASAGLVTGAMGYGVKSYLGYVQTKQKYQLALTTSLYYQNLDNNAGVLHRLVDEAEEQDFREVAAAFALLLSRHRRPFATLDELDLAVESFFVEHFGCSVDFEIDDALEKLRRYGLIQRETAAAITAVPLETAHDRLRRRWATLIDSVEGVSVAASTEPAIGSPDHATSSRYHDRRIS